MIPTDPNEQAPRTPKTAPAEPDDGVDITLIRWMLSLSVPERLAYLQNQANSLVRLRNAASGS